MNIELRKLLAQFQDARSKIDVWQDEFSREDSGAHVPSGDSTDEQSALIESSPFATSLNRFHKLCLKTSFLPPEVQLETVMEIARKQFAGKIPLQVVVQHLLWAQPQFTAIRYRLARAVQPMGKPAPSPDQSAGETSAPEGEKPNVAKTRRTKADRFPKNLKIIIEAVLTPDDVTASPGEWEKIGEEYHDEIDVIKAEMIWRRTIREKFAHKTDKALPPVIAPAPLPSIPGTLCAPAFAAQIITDKFEDHIPHYRQSKRLRRRFDVDIGRQTINAWNHCFADHLTPIGKAIKAEVLEATELQVDETPIEYLKPGHGSTKLGYLPPRQTRWPRKQGRR